jgi:hypothetical protein
MNIRYRVELSAEERDELAKMLSAGKCAARKLKRAQILLAADAGISDVEIERTISIGDSTIYRTKRRFVSRCLIRAGDTDRSTRHKVYRGERINSVTILII